MDTVTAGIALDDARAPITIPSLPDPAAVEAPAGPEQVLDELVEAVPGVHGLVLASADGFAVATSSGVDDGPAHAAMLAAVTALAEQLVEAGGGRELRQLAADHELGVVLVWPIGNHRSLAVIADTVFDHRRLRMLVDWRSASLLGGPA